MRTIAFLITTPSLMFMETGEYNGYVAVPPEHPLYGKDYGTEEAEALDVHGGITLACEASELRNDIDIFMDCKEPPRDWWVFGYDTCHYGDNPERWNLNRCTEETRRLQKQLEELFAQSK